MSCPDESSLPTGRAYRLTGQASTVAGTELENSSVLLGGEHPHPAPRSTLAGGDHEAGQPKLDGSGPRKIIASSVVGGPPELSRDEEIEPIGQSSGWCGRRQWDDTTGADRILTDVNFFELL